MFVCSTYDLSSFPQIRYEFRSSPCRFKEEKFFNQAMTTLNYLKERSHAWERESIAELIEEIVDYVDGSTDVNFVIIKDSYIGESESKYRKFTDDFEIKIASLNKNTVHDVTLEVVRQAYISCNFSKKKTAKVLGITTHTVRKHLQAVLDNVNDSF